MLLNKIINLNAIGIIKVYFYVMIKIHGNDKKIINKNLH